jgi:hypothetical protein
MRRKNSEAEKFSTRRSAFVFFKLNSKNSRYLLRALDLSRKPTTVRSISLMVTVSA